MDKSFEYSGAERLTQAIRSGNPALGVFVTSGFPSKEDTLELLRATDRAGADFIELGMPFSDPLAEGPPIQRSSARALAGGVKMAWTLEIARKFRAESETPVVLMGYANPIYRYGIGNFFDDARSSGVDGIILPDVPLEECEPFTTEANRAGVGFVFLIAPTTPDERMRELANQSRGFVYAVSMTGVTGSSLPGQDGSPTADTGPSDTDQIGSYLDRARKCVGSIPLMVGFGVRTHADVKRVSQHSNGAIVGSAVSETIETLWNDPGLTQTQRYSAVEQFVRELKYGHD